MIFCSIIILLLAKDAICKKEVECKPGFKTVPAPDLYAVAKYPSENVPQGEPGYMIPFNELVLCHIFSNSNSRIAVTVQHKKRPLHYKGSVPTHLVRVHNTKEYTPEDQANKEPYFEILETPQSDDQDIYKMNIVLPEVTLENDGEYVATLSLDDATAHSLTTKWTGHLHVTQRAMIERSKDDAVAVVGTHKIGDTVRSLEVRCGSGTVRGTPTPNVRWLCAGNANFSYTSEPGGVELTAPNSPKLQIYKYWDKDKCIMNSVVNLTCEVTNVVRTDAEEVIPTSDSVNVSMEVVNVHYEQQVMQCSKKDSTLCTEFDINELYTNGSIPMKLLEDWFANIPSSFTDLCKVFLKQLICNMFAKECTQHDKLHCSQECGQLRSCLKGVDYNSILAGYGSPCSKLGHGKCPIQFGHNLTYLSNQTDVYQLGTYELYNGNMSRVGDDVNNTCQDWDEILRSNDNSITQFSIARGFDSGKYLSGNYCRSSDVPKSKILYCFVNNTKEKCIKETIISPPPITSPPDPNFFASLIEIVKKNWVPIVVGAAVTVLILGACVGVCIWLKTAPQVMLPVSDMNGFDAANLRKNPLYNPTLNPAGSGHGSAQRVPHQTPGTQHQGLIQPYNSRGTPPVTLDWRPTGGGTGRYTPGSQRSNFYVSTPGNSLSRDSSLGPSYRYHGQYNTGGSSGTLGSTRAYGGFRGPHGGGRERDPQVLVKFEYDRNKIRYVNDVGSGAFGRVFHAKAPGLCRGYGRDAHGNEIPGSSEMDVAVKMLKEEASDEVIGDFKQEAALLANFNHPNIIKLLGVCSAGKPFCLLLEYMQKGDLAEFLRNNGPDSDTDVKSRQNLKAADLILISQQVASGMSYISEKCYIHRDLATRNCLVSENMSVKIADFGLSQYIGQEEYLYVDDNDAIPIRWIAPEALQTNRYTKASDVWAFGVLLWEVFSFGKQPYYMITSHEQVIEHVTMGNVLTIPNHTPEDVYEVMKECWNMEPSRRPSFRNLYEILDNLLKRYTSPHVESFC